MTENQQGRERESGGWVRLLTVIASAAILIAAYGLSSGPAAWLLCHSESGTIFWNRAYWPVIRFLEVSPLDTSFLLYVNWWVNLSNSWASA
jgi:hypothetical protein